MMPARFGTPMHSSGRRLISMSLVKPAARNAARASSGVLPVRSGIAIRSFGSPVAAVDVPDELDEAFDAFDDDAFDDDVFCDDVGPVDDPPAKPDVLT